MITRIRACGLNNIRSGELVGRSLINRAPPITLFSVPPWYIFPYHQRYITLALHLPNPHQCTTHITHAGRLPTLAPGPRYHTVHTTHARSYDTLLLKLKRKAAAKLQKRRLFNLLSLVCDFIDSSVLQVFLSITSSENN